MPTNPQTQTAPQKVKRSKWFWVVITLTMVGIYLGYRALVGKAIEAKGGSFTLWPYIVGVIALWLLYKFVKKPTWRAMGKKHAVKIALAFVVILLVGTATWFLEDLHEEHVRVAKLPETFATMVRKYGIVLPDSDVTFVHNATTSDSTIFIVPEGYCSRIEPVSSLDSYIFEWQGGKATIMPGKPLIWAHGPITVFMLKPFGAPTTAVRIWSYKPEPYLPKGVCNPPNKGSPASRGPSSFYNLLLR